MQIKRFEAPTMTEALRMIKKEFGPDAVILSARSLSQEKSLFGIKKPAGIEVTAATDTFALDTQEVVETRAATAGGRGRFQRPERPATFLFALMTPSASKA